MAKIDITKIEGYEAMSPEEKIAALEAFEYDDGASVIERQKQAISSANADASNWKKKYKELLSDDDRKKQESTEELEQLRAEVTTLKQEKTQSEYVSKLLAQGYSETLAADTAKAMIEGDTTKVFANQQAFLVEYEKKVKADALKSTPRPPAGDGSVTTDYTKLKEEALKRSDSAAYAYYTRLEAESEKAAKQ